MALDPGRTVIAINPETHAIGMAAVMDGDRGEVHIHGTGIDVIGNELPNDISALATLEGGAIHATQSSFVMSTGSGGREFRILNLGGTVKAPYLWEPDVLNKNLFTEDGADITTEMVCTDASCLANVPHQLIYSSGCNINGPWFDTVTGVCRGM